MNFSNIISGLCALLFLMIGLDKFFNFLEPPCSLMESISPTVWKLLGVIQLTGAILIITPKFRRVVAIFFLLFMCFFSIYHLTQSTYDIGGSSFMAVLLAILVWNPRFIKG